MSLLITRPRYELVTHYFYHWSEEIVKEAKERMIGVTDLQKEKASRKLVESYLAGILAMGNFWFTNEGVMKQIKAKDANVAELVTYQRCIFDRSVIVVKMKDGTQQEYLLDTNCLFNYRFKLKTE